MELCLSVKASANFFVLKSHQSFSLTLAVEKSEKEIQIVISCSATTIELVFNCVENRVSPASFITEETVNT